MNGWIMGDGPSNQRRFQRIVNGKMELTEFEEVVYASITDMEILTGTAGYEEVLGKPFPQAPYSKLA